jgi:spore coat-associated protein N
MLSSARLWTTARRVLVVLVALVAATFLFVAAGAATGRFRPLPVDERGADVHVARSSIAVVVPVPLRSLHEGDIVLAQPARGHKDALYRVSAVDSWTHQPIVQTDQGHQTSLSLGDSVWRVSTVVPFGGTLYRLLVGTLQAILLLLACMALVARAAVQRRRRSEPVELPRTREGLVAMLRAEVACAIHNPSRSARRSFVARPWWWTRFAAIVVGTLGVLSLTASATFVGSVAVSQSALTAAHMQLTAPGAGATNRLTLGASAIVPGDLMQRAIDLSVDASTTSGAMTGITLQAAASPTSLLDSDTTNDLRVWVQKCASAWTESGSSPAFTYSCTGGAGNVSDVMGSSLPYQPPANTCPPSSGTVVPLHTLKASAQTLSNVSTTASSTMHLLVLMCFPTAAGDSFQDATSTLTFTFAGVQRAGTNK